MFRLVATVKQGTASDLAEASARYPTLEAARTAAATLMERDQVVRILIVRADLAGGFVEWFHR